MITWRTIFLLSVFVVFGLLSACAQSTGDYRSVVTGSWDTLSTWEKFNGTTWEPATVFPNDSTVSVTISAGDTVVFNASPRRAFNVTVEAGGMLYANTSTNRYLRVNGTQIQNDGQIGAAVDGLGLEFYGGVTLKGGGTNYICRIRPVSGVKGASFTFDANATITYQGSSGTGGVGVYFLNSANDSITYLVKFGRTVTFVDQCSFATSATATSKAAVTGTFQTDGIVDILGRGNFSLRTSAGKTATLIVNATLKVGQNLYLSSATGGPYVMTVGTSAVMQVGTGTPGTCDFANPANVVTGDSPWTQ